MEQDIQKILITEEQLRTRIAQLGQQLTQDYAGKTPVIVGVLKGVVVFYADMIRQIKVPCQMDFMWISSYQGTNSTGNSLDFTYRHLMAKQPASLKICTLLDKPERRKPGITLKPDYVGFTVPNEFVVGYGLDYNELYRNLPYVGVLKPEVYEK